MELRFWAATDTGVVRDHNEDNFLVDQNLQLFIVCDGMGGHAAGEVASAVCVRTVRDVVADNEELLAKLRRNPDDEAAAQNLKATLRRAVKAGNAKIWEMAQEDPSRKGMGTTCTTVVLVGNRGFVGHVGDSRLYRMRDEAVEQMTDDHSLLNEMIRQGQVAPGTTEEEFKHQNAVTRAVGVRQSVDVDAFSIDLVDRDRLLICSDGLSEYVDDPVDVAGMMREGDPREVTDGCIDYAKESGGKDNITVVVIDCEEESEGDDESADDAGSQSEDESRFRLEEEALEVIGQTPYFHYLSASELERLLEVTRGMEAEAGDEIIGESQDNDRLFVILDGAVSLSVGGDEIGVLNRGQHFGEMALIDAQDDGEINMVAEAVESSTFLVVERDDFVGLFESSPDLAVKLLWNFVQVFADRLQEAPPQFRYELGEGSADLDSISEVTGTTTVSEERLEEMAEGKDSAAEEAGQDEESPRESPAVEVSPDEGGVEAAGAEESEPRDRLGDDIPEPAIDETGRLEGDDLPPLEADEETSDEQGRQDGDEDEKDRDEKDRDEQERGDGDEVPRETMKLHAAQRPGSGEEETTEGAGGSVPSDDSDGDESSPSVQMNVPGRQEPEEAGEADEQSGDEDLRTTVQLDWNEKDIDLDRRRPGDDPREANRETDEDDSSGESTRDRLDSLTGSGKSLRDELRDRLDDEEGSAPGAGVLSTPGEESGDSDEADGEAASGGDVGGEAPGEDDPRDGDRSDDSAGASEDPKVMVSPDLMADSDDGD